MYPMQQGDEQRSEAGTCCYKGPEPTSEQLLDQQFSDAATAESNTTSFRGKVQ